jgi:hypothetical protein
MGYKFNPFTGMLDVVGAPINDSLLFKGTLVVASDFPTSAEVQTGWFYIVTANVTDNDPTKTNTGQSFLKNDEIVWNGSNWTVIGQGGLTDEKVKYNVILNAFRIAVQGSLSIFNMVDGFVDEYEDETGIDTAASSNEVYDETNDLYTNISEETKPSTILKIDKEP